MSHLLFVDLSNQVYKAAASHPGLSFRHHFTGGTYGVLTAVSKIINEVGASRVVICCDSPPYVRKQEDPRYKSDRGPMDEVLLMHASETKRQCFEMFDILGIPAWKSKGFESDDLIAWGVSHYRHRFQKLTAASNDSDLYLLFWTDNFQIHRGKNGVYTRQDMLDEFGSLSLLYWKDILSIVGTHNAVPGIHGIGYKTALKMIEDSDKFRRFCNGEHAELIQKNRELIELPHPRFEPTDEMRIIKGRYNERTFIRFLSSLGISLTSAMREALERVST